MVKGNLNLSSYCSLGYVTVTWHNEIVAAATTPAGCNSF